MRWREASRPPTHEILSQQKIHIIRAAVTPAVSGWRIEISSPLFTHLLGLETACLIQDMLASQIVDEVTPD
jgi:hypothetical protein